MSQTQLLFVGDIHLGRRPTRLPDLQEYGIDARALTPAAAWRTTVQYAIDQRVDAVVLAGDVVDTDNARYEAYGQLAEGVQKLVSEGIRIRAVAGNHDVYALPKLANEITDFRLLGVQGTWEHTTIGGIHLVGWSFPVQHVEKSPFQTSPLPDRPQDGKPILGVLHCDLDQTGSRYAPVTRAELDRTGYQGWFLGHIHKPADLHTPPHQGYLGSLMGLDIGENGAHGPWLVRSHPGKLEVEQVMLSPLRWEKVPVPVDPLKEGDEFSAILTSSANVHVESIAEGLGQTRAVGLRITLEGRTKQHRRIRQQVLSGEHKDLVIPYGETCCFIESVIDHSRPDLNLEVIARTNDPAGILARHLLNLQQGNADLIRDVLPQLRDVTSNPVYSSLEDGQPDESRARDLLLSSGMRVLDGLLEQVEAARG